MGSRARGTATADSDYDLIVLVSGDGGLQLPDRLAWRVRGWGWLAGRALASIGLTPKNVPCDVMLVSVSHPNYHRAGGIVFPADLPHVLLWRRP